MLRKHDVILIGKAILKLWIKSVQTLIKALTNNGGDVRLSQTNVGREWTNYVLIKDTLKTYTELI